MSLKSQDVMVCLKLAVSPDELWNFGTLAASLGMSASETHGSIQRLRQSRLLGISGRRPLRRNLEDMMLNGLKFFFPAEQKGQVGGLPTAYAASPLRELMMSTNSPPPVWPWPTGTAFGFELVPLYRTAPFAALQDPQLYELLALADALRLHQARVSELAANLFHERLTTYSARWRE